MRGHPVLIAQHGDRDLLSGIFEEMPKVERGGR